MKVCGVEYRETVVTITNREKSGATRGQNRVLYMEKYGAIEVRRRDASRSTVTGSTEDLYEARGFMGVRKLAQ